jgi:hypothetical protein
MKDGTGSCAPRLTSVNIAGMDHRSRQTASRNPTSINCVCGRSRGAAIDGLPDSPDAGNARFNGISRGCLERSQSVV